MLMLTYILLRTRYDRAGLKERFVFHVSFHCKKQNKTKQNKTKQNKTKQYKTKPNQTKKTKQSKTKTNKQTNKNKNKTKQNKTKQNKNKTKQNIPTNLSAKRQVLDFSVLGIELSQFYGITFGKSDFFMSLF